MFCRNLLPVLSLPNDQARGRECCFGIQNRTSVLVFSPHSSIPTEGLLRTFFLNRARGLMTQIKLIVNLNFEPGWPAARRTFAPIRLSKALRTAENASVHKYGTQLMSTYPMVVVKPFYFRYLGPS